MGPIYGAYVRQSFTLPDSIIYYISRNPSTPKCYQKMIQSCKYFFIKNPILVLHCLFYKSGQWKTCSSKSCNTRDSKTIIFNDTSSFKIWITDTIRIISSNQSNNNFISTIIPRIYKSDVTCFTISNVTIYFDHLFLLASTSQFLSFDKTFIKQRNGNSISIPNIIEYFPKICGITFYNAHDFTVTSDTVKELIKLPNFSKIWSFEIYCIPQSFDIDTLYKYIKKNKNTQFYLKFDGSISETYKDRLEEIVDQLIEADPKFSIPYIAFPGMDEIKRKQILKRYMNSL